MKKDGTIDDNNILKFHFSDRFTLLIRRILQNEIEFEIAFSHIVLFISILNEKIFLSNLQSVY